MTELINTILPAEDLLDGFPDLSMQIPDDPGERSQVDLMNPGWGKFASFLDEDGNKYGLKG
jgi:hypothetical protein